LTFAGVFAVDKTGKELAVEMTKLLANKNIVEVKASKKAMFGPQKNIAVMKIEKTRDLMNLYNLIYGWLESIGASYNSPEYQGGGYVPHVTFQKSGSLKTGERRVLQSVSLIDLFPNRD